MNPKHCRLVNGLAYEQLVRMVGTRSISAARRHALGEMWPNAERLGRILFQSARVVTIEAMHRRHLGWLRSPAGTLQEG